MLKDDDSQSQKAERLVEQLTESKPGFVSVVVIVELAWVLEKVYNFADRQIAMAIERMLQVDVLVVEHHFEVYLAVVALRKGQGHFGDALIGAIARRAGCKQILTFDRKATRLPGFALL